MRASCSSGSSLGISVRLLRSSRCFLRRTSPVGSVGGLALGCRRVFPPSTITRRYQCHKSTAAVQTPPLSILSSQFWSSKSAWNRASVNTFRCLVGCSTGDFSALWLLQTYSPEMPVMYSMGISMAAGLTTSITLETVLLRLGKDRMSWPVALQTAAGMSLVSMLAMETVENLVDYHLTGGIVNIQDPAFWMAAGLAMAAGFLAPLPYNYFRLRKFGKACH